MAQVKFYSVSNLPSSPNDGGVYFVNGGELYKGSQRFGANKIFTAAAGASTLAEATAGITGAIGGDILTGFGATKIYTGNASATPSWVDVKQNQDALDQQLKALVSSLAFASDSGLYITGITQDSETGAVEAHTSNFATDVKTAIGDGSASSVANGITVSVVTTSGSVTNVYVSAANLDVTSISATNGSFTNLNVTGTASFTATTISADALTIGGSAIGDLISAGADARIAAIAENTATSTANGITVSVTTAAGSVTQVELDASAFDNAMHFIGVFSNTASVTAPENGDVIVIGGVTDSSSNFKDGQEYVYVAPEGGTPSWEIIGSQAAWQNFGTATGKDFTDGPLNPTGTDLPTESAVATYVSWTSTSTSNVNTVEVTGTVNAGAKTFTIGLSGVGTAASKDFTTATISASDTIEGKTNYGKVATAEAVAAYVEGKWNTLSAAAFYSVRNTTLDSTANYLPTESVVAAYVASAISSAALSWTSTSTVTCTYNSSVTLEVGIDMSAQTISASLTGLSAAASMPVVSTSGGIDTPEEGLVTASATKAYVEYKIGQLDASVSSSENNSIAVEVTQVDGKVTSVTADLLWLDGNGAVITA